MDENEVLFHRLLRKLEAGGVLQQIVLIGSWVLPVYRSYFDNDPEIPLLRTTDVDFLIGMPPRITMKLDMPGMLFELGFETLWSLNGEYCKYIHPEMEVEFLIPDQGAGKGKAIFVEQLGIQAQPLRYLSLAYDRSFLVGYQGLNVRVPEPEVFVLLKLLIIPRRKDPAKLEKDIETVKGLGMFLLRHPERRMNVLSLLGELPRGWQKTIIRSSQKYFPDLADQVSDSHL